MLKLQPLKIFLAEDDLDDQLLFNEFLGSRSDIQLLPIAENGVVLLEELDKIRDAINLPDIIILDQNMPKKNGLVTLQLLKEHKRYKLIPVIIYSTYTDKNLIETCRLAGAAAVILKPISKIGYQEMIDTCKSLAVCYS